MIWRWVWCVWVSIETKYEVARRLVQEPVECDVELGGEG